MDAAIAPFRVSGPGIARRPVIISVPHAGRYYPEGLLAMARVGRHQLEQLEDRFVDQLAIAAAADGFSVVTATIARACIDLNRSEDEWDAALVSDARPPPGQGTRVRAGLGLVPRRMHPVGDLWQRRLTKAELDDRVARIHRPYHQAIGLFLARAQAEFGGAVLIDLHSMPTPADGGASFVIGDRFGACAGAQLVDRLLAQAEGFGLSVARNAPYAGAHGIAAHADRARGVEAVQIEFDRSLYIASDTGLCADSAAQLARLVRTLALAAEDHVLRRAPCAIAAE